MRIGRPDRAFAAVSAVLLLLLQSMAFAQVCIPDPASSAADAADPHAGHHMMSAAEGHAAAAHHASIDTPPADANAAADGDCCGSDCECPSACSGSAAALLPATSMTLEPAQQVYPPVRSVAVSLLPDTLFRPPISA